MSFTATMAALAPTIAPAAPPPVTGDGVHWVHNLDPVALHLGFFELRWYSLAYLAGIICGYFYLRRLLAEPGAPMARRHADDIVFYMTLGIILGGRLGYVLFYQPDHYLQRPLDIVKLWDGGMSFHGGLLGSVLAMWFLARRNRLSFLRVADYISLCVPFGLFFGRLANFVNGELWGAPTEAAWGVIFPSGGDVARHPSQLYEAALEGVLLFATLWTLFWFTRARYRPGLLAGVFVLGYGLCRVAVELVREPDVQLAWLKAQTGLSMGQWLCVPMILVGLWAILTAGRREARLVVEPALEQAPEPA